MSERAEGKMSLQHPKQEKEEIDEQNFRKEMEQAVAAVAEKLKAEGAGRGHSWNVGDPVYLTSAGSDHMDTTQKRRYFTENACISEWQDTAISSVPYDSIEAAIDEILRRVRHEILLGAKVTVDPYGAGYDAKYPSEDLK